MTKIINLRVIIRKLEEVQIQTKSQNFNKSRNIFNPNQNVSQLDLVRAIFYTHQTSGPCAGVCTGNCMHQMEKIDCSYKINTCGLKIFFPYSCIINITQKIYYKIHLNAAIDLPLHSFLINCVL